MCLDIGFKIKKEIKEKFTRFIIVKIQKSVNSKFTKKNAFSFFTFY